LFKTKLIPYNLSEFNLSQVSFSYIDKILGLFLGLGSAIVGIYGMMPKIKNTKILSTYIDYGTNQLIEETEYDFSWGRVFQQKVKLPKLPRDSTFQLLYKPSISFKQLLPKDAYEVVEKGSTRIITLTDKSFFDEAETNYVDIVTTTSIKDEYKAKINCALQGNLIVITNDNYIKICNYAVKLPPELGINQLTVFNYVSEIINPGIGDSSEGIKLIVEIPARQANSLGRKVIPLQGT
jgi:hypothetical protein